MCSGIHKYTGCLPACSPNGRYIASAKEYRLTIRELENLQVVQLYSCLDRIRTIEWCSRSEYLVCGLQNRAIVQVCCLIRSFGACCDHSHHESQLAASLLPPGSHEHACIVIQVWSASDQDWTCKIDEVRCPGQISIATARVRPQGEPTCLAMRTCGICASFLDCILMYD